MTAVSIRKKLVDYLQIADDKKLKALYALLEEEIEQEGRVSIAQYNKEFKAGETEFRDGEFISHAAMKKMVKQWENTTA